MRRVTVFCATLLLLSAGCARGWKADESDRIDQAMSCPPFDPESKEARGIALAPALPQAPPFAGGGGYAIRRERGRKLRLGRSEPDPPRVKKPKAAKAARAKKSRNAAARAGPGQAQR